MIIFILIYKLKLYKYFANYLVGSKIQQKLENIYNGFKIYGDFIKPLHFRIIWPGFSHISNPIGKAYLTNTCKKWLLLKGLINDKNNCLRMRHRN